MKKGQTAVFKTEQVIGLIDELSGNLTAVAKRLKCSRPTLYKFVKAHPTVQDALDSAREVMLDNAESSLYRNALNGDTTALIFFLKTQGKKRGYVERVESTGPGGKPIQTETRYIEMSDDELDGRIAELEAQRTAGISASLRGAEPSPD